MAKEIEIGDGEVALGRSLCNKSSISTVVIPLVIPTVIESEQNRSLQASGEETSVASTPFAANQSVVKRGGTCNSDSSGSKRLKVTPCTPCVAGPLPTIKVEAEDISNNSSSENGLEDPISIGSSEIENQQELPISNNIGESDSQPASTDTSQGESGDNVASNSASARIPAPEQVAKLASTAGQDVERASKEFEYNTRSKGGMFSPQSSGNGIVPMTSGHPIASTSFLSNEEELEIVEAIVSTTVAEIVRDKYDVDLFLKRIKTNYKHHDSWDLTVKSMKMMEIERDNGTLFDNTDLLDTYMRNTYWLRRHLTMNRKLTTYEAIRRFPGLQDYRQIQHEFGRCNSVLDVQKFEETIKSQLLQRDSWQLHSNHPWCTEASNIIGAAQIDADETLAARMLLYICEKSDHKGALKILNFIEKNDVIDGQDSLTARDKTGLKTPRLQPSINLNWGLENIYGKCSVNCDNEEILTDLPFWKAVFVLYYLFYVFHMEYTPLDRKIFKEFDKIAKEC